MKGISTIGCDIWSWMGHKVDMRDRRVVIMVEGSVVGIRNVSENRCLKH